MALKKVTSINTNSIKQIVLKDVIVDDTNNPIALDNMLSCAESQEICYVDSEGKSKPIYFEIDDLPYCCGLYEIGNLNNINFVSQKAFNVLMKGLLTSNITFIVNTNNETASKTWEEKLVKSKMFTCVKQFTNPNSNNPIKVWVSNKLK